MSNPINYKLTAAGSLLASLLAIAAPSLRAQTVPATNSSGPAEDTIVLSPFVIDASEDANGYAANSTLAGTRIRTDLKDVASSISVVTKQFLQDTAVHNEADLLVYTPNTEVGGLRGNYSGQGARNSYSEPLINPSSNNRVRGLDTADNTRDFFLTDIPFDTFNVDRVDLQRGPNSILFGVGSPAGIINASLNSASFKDGYKVENVTSKFGSERNSVDFNQVVIPDQLAIRVAALNDDEKYQQKPAFNNTIRYYGAIRFDPKLFSDSVHTSFQANFEIGRVNSNNPRTVPPDDEITRFFASGTQPDGTPGLNKVNINENIPGQGAGSDLAKADFPNYAVGRTYWPNPILYYNGSAPGSNGVSPTTLSGLPTQAIIGEETNGFAINAQGQSSPPNQPGGSKNIGISGQANYQPVAIAPYINYAGKYIPGGSFYADKVLTNPSIFDFYNKLLDGDNKREWQTWHAGNVSLAQTFFNDRVGYQLAYDQQRYTSGQRQALAGGYAINVDVNATLIDGTANPNVDRPYVASGGDSGNQSTSISRDSTRLTAYGEFRASDFWNHTWLAKIIGNQRFTGLLALDHKKQTDVGWSSYALDPSYETDNNFDTSVKISNYRVFNWVDYIGPNLSGASSASNANLSNVQTHIAAPQNTSVEWFNSHWNHSLNPADPGYVDPNAPYTYLDSNTGGVNAATGIVTPTNSTQSNNPANYVGWQKLPVTYLSSYNPSEFPSLVTSGERTRFRDTSKALVWQGFLLDGDLVGTYGWRKDSIVNFDTAAPIDATTSLAALNYSDNPVSRESTEGQTRTWGAVYHLPKELMKRLPWDSGISLFYNRSHNFKADAPRQNLFGQQIPNPDGLTKEYGITVSTLSDRLSLKAIHYQTVVHYATLTSDALGSLGNLSYLTDLIPAWGYGYAAQVQAGLDGKYGNATTSNNSWDYVAKDALTVNPNADLSVIGTPAGAAKLPVATYGYGGTGTVTMTDIVNAWINMPVPDNFFDFYGITGNRPEPALTHSTGKLYEGFLQPFANGDVPGVGGQQPSISHTPVTTVDNVSKGWEFELTGQPTKNWNITLNYSRTEATKTNIDAVTQKFMADNLAFYEGPGGQLRLWGAGQTAGYGTPTNPGQTPEIYPFTKGQNNGSTVGPQWIYGVYNPYLVIASAQGQSAPEVSPWRLNLVTTYSFDQSAIKGLFVGGGVRVEAGRILGYRYDTTSGILDTNQQLIGPNDRHFDLWVGYNRKIGVFSGHHVNWRIQLNLRDVGQKAHLVDARYEPDGTLALARIQDGMSWQLTNTFEF